MWMWMSMSMSMFLDLDVHVVSTERSPRDHIATRRWSTRASGTVTSLQMRQNHWPGMLINLAILSAGESKSEIRSFGDLCVIGSEFLKHQRLICLYRMPDGWMSETCECRVIYLM